MSTRFPADRFIYVYNQDDSLTSAAGAVLDVFVDQACLTPAVLTNLAGTPILSRLIVEGDSLVPEFLDTQDHLVLYVRQMNSVEVSEISAVTSDLIGAGVQTYLIDNPPFLPLSVAASVPPGTPDGTLIVRYQTP